MLAKHTWAALCSVAALAIAGSADAAAKLFTFDQTATPGLGSGPFGMVTATDVGTNLQIDVSLNSNWEFRDSPDSNHWALNFQLPSTGHGVSGVTPGIFFKAPGGSFTAAGFSGGSNIWNYAIDVTSYVAGKPATGKPGKPGYKPATPAVPGAIAGWTTNHTDSPTDHAFNPQTLSFLISGAQTGDLQGRAFGSTNVFFVADVVNSTGATGNIGATLPAVITEVTHPTGVPEPATWAMIVVGFGGLGGAMRSRRKQAVSAA